MSSHATGGLLKMICRPALAASLAVLGACSTESGNAVAPVDPSPSVTSLTLGQQVGPLFVGDTAQLTVTALDGAGKPVTGAQVTWSVSSPVLASVTNDGKLVAQGHGEVSVTATSGSVSASTNVTLRLTTESRRFAYAWVNDPTASAPYRPTASYAHNETGGGVTVTRAAVGQYTLAFERLAKVDSTFRETVLVTPYGSQGERCHLNGWGNASNGVDLNVSVSCYTFGGAPIDSRFSVLVVGSGTMSSRHGFTVTGDAAASYAAQPTHSYSSFAASPFVSRTAAGSYLVLLHDTPDNTPQNVLVSTVGGAGDLCKVSSWNRTEWASVICYAPSGALSDARFSLLMVESGRPGRRFGYAWAHEPAVAIGGTYTPSMQHQRTSSGQAVTITHQATGSFIVSFPGLAKVGGRPETVQVSPYGGGLFSCQVEGWSNSAESTSLDARVRCWNRATGDAADTYFTILVVE